ncbi:MAG TPA: hypothetical protein VFW83_10495 [Bryobacteraceae bacterium]|nr:hypothetical protein [Bryobacteraceae bacterium]
MQWVLVLALAFDLAAAKSERNLEKRSDLALKNASQALDAAREAYGQGKIGDAQSKLEEVGESVDLSYQSLKDSGKDPRRSPKYFKRAEMKTRELLRHLDEFRESMNLADRDPLDRIRAHISEIHDNLLQGLLTNKKKRK